MSVTYFVDCVLGNDTNTGRTAYSPWKSLDRVNSHTFAPGDRILFHAGQTWHGQLWPKGSGAPEAPITVGRYGDGDKPRIDAGGTHGTAEGHYLDGAAVVLFNQDYWEIEDLDITNFNPFYRQAFEYFTPDGRHNVPIPSPRNRYRYGVLVRWDNYGTGRHVYLRRLDIHDINGEMQRFCADGILISCSGAEGSDLTVVPTRGVTPTHFENVHIEDCSICRIDRTGISVWSQWSEGGAKYPGNLAETGNFYHTTVGDWVGCKGLVIRGCFMSHTAGDGILVNGTEGAVIEHNYVEHTCEEMRIGANAAVWPQSTVGTVMQYNEVCYTHGVQDGQAFDVDFACYDTVIQYNYTHDNEGGFLLLMNGIYDTTVRFNISQNDHNGLVWIHENEGTRFYNNTFYMGIEESKPFRGPYDNSTWTFTNNIFCFREPSQVKWSEGATYRGNCYVNVNVPDDPEAVTEGPGFADPSLVRLHTGPADYRLAPDSPCRNAGVEISDNGGFDFFGEPANGAFIGASCI